MDVKVNKISTNQIELEIKIAIPQVSIYFNLAASELSQDMKVAGFRPGKVPIDIVEKEKGSQKLYDHAANLAIQKTLPEAILSNELNVIGQPDITVTQIARGNPMIYKAKFWTIPEVELGNYKGLKVKKQKLEVKDEEIENALKHLQKSRAKLITVNRPAKKGDRVEIDFNENKNHPLVIGDGRFVPGFEKEIEGMKNGEEKKFTLADKNLDFQVKMKLVQEQEIPELSDEFAKSLGKFQSLEDLKKNINEGIFQEKEVKEKERIRMELIEEVVKNSKMDIPEALIDIELNKMINELQASVQNMGLDLDKYLGEIKKTVDDLRKDWHEQAVTRAKTGITLKAIAKKEKIEPNDEEIEDKINEILKSYSNIEEAEKKIDQEALKHYTKDIIKNEKVFQLLEREAKIK